LEPMTLGNIGMLFSRISPKIIEHFFKSVPGIGLIGNLVDTALEGQKKINEIAQKINYYSINYEDTLRWEGNAATIWPIMKADPNLKEPVFVVFDIAGGSPRGDELLKIINKIRS